MQHNYYNARIHFVSAKFRFGPSRSTYNFIHKKVPIVTNPLKYLCTQKMAAHIVINMLDAIKNDAENKNANRDKSSQIPLHKKMAA